MRQQIRNRIEGPQAVVDCFFDVVFLRIEILNETYPESISDIKKIGTINLTVSLSRHPDLTLI